MRASILAVLVAASTAACVRAPDPLTFSEDAVSVHAVLRATDTEARLWLHRVTPSGKAAVQGATLSLASGGAAVALTQVAPEQSDGCFTPYGGTQPASALQGCFGGALPGPAAAGSRWTLSATVPGYGAVSGATTIPALPVVTEPAAASRYVVTDPQSGRPGSVEIPIVWSAPGAARVEFGMAQGVAFRGGQIVDGAICSAWWEGRPPVHDRSSGSLTMRVHGVGCGDRSGMVQWDSAAIDLMVTAYDSAYAAYALHGSSTSRGRGGRGLEGAYGVFGSVASTPRRLMFLRDR